MASAKAAIPASAATPTRRQWTVACIMAFSILCQSSIFGVLAPFYPIEARLKHNTNFQIGLVFSTFSIVGFFSSPIVGKLLSGGVSSKAVLIAGIVLGGSLFIVQGLLDRVRAGTPFFVANLVCRFVLTLGTSMCYNCCYSISAVELKPYRPLAVAALETMFGLGMMLGPVCGGALYEIGGYPLPFYVFGGIFLALGCVAFVFLPKTEVQKRVGAPINWKSVNVHILFDMLAILFVFSLQSYNQISLSTELQRYGMSVQKMGVVFLTCAAVYGVSSLIWGFFVKRITDARYFVLAGAAIASSAAFAMKPVEFLGVTTTLPMQIVAQGCIGIGLSAVFVCSTLHGMHYAVHKLGFPDDITTHGFISGLFMTAKFSGCFIGPVAGSVISDLFGYGTTLAALSGLGVLTTLCILTGLWLEYRCKLEQEAESPPNE